MKRRHSLVSTLGIVVGVILGVGLVLYTQTFASGATDPNYMIQLQDTYHGAAGQRVGTRLQSLQKRHVTVPNMQQDRLFYEGVPAVQQYYRDLFDALAPVEEVTRSAAPTAANTLMCRIVQNLVADVNAGIDQSIPDDYSYGITRGNIAMVLDDLLGQYCTGEMLIQMRNAAPEQSPPTSVPNITDVHFAAPAQVQAAGDCSSLSPRRAVGSAYCAAPGSPAATRGTLQNRQTSNSTILEHLGLQ